MKMSLNVRNNPSRLYFMQPFLTAHAVAPRLVPQHAHAGEYEWFYCTAGGGVQLVKDWARPVRPGQLLLIPPGIPHVFCAREESGCHCDVFMLPADYFEEGDAVTEEARRLLRFWDRYVGGHGYLAELPPAQEAYGGEIIRRLGRALGTGGFGSLVRQRAAVYELLALAFDLPDPPSPALETVRRDGPIDEVLYHLNNHFSRRITVEEACRLAGLGRSSFHKRFAAATGMTFCRYLNRLRLHAAELLIRDGVKREEAALRCGFTSRSNYYQQLHNELDDGR